ncbi:2-C-methyl-D-erythritol 4-phosphate cytidylyltransferase [Roseicitreum antarcticum]|uniref:2-C-methyl-D-erythritol 4-phosphate cytidylyltransferase n=1 Tax=Roseicitreum antarcticum TaxID=564137 RepID=A0A1H3C4P3_9RHOB|nr:2-C-methyl-D-erythritol 4-phosphate cytidylyltransferase [Roseicitreum antarcticum]SDX49071.1 2-C-methyl-D-erythritol 4-phosphate cytidylyltransferase [Roseicitreum antarcticum]
MPQPPTSALPHDAPAATAGDVAAIIVAAGRGTRAGGDAPKQWQTLCGQMVLAHTLDAILAAGIGRVVLVLHPDDTARARPLLRDGVTVVTGGESRAGSVRNALEHLSHAPPGLVLIHDGARPLIARAVIARVLDALHRHPGAAPALPITDALWRGVDGRVTGTQARDGLFRAQTPQGFRFHQILSAHRAHQGDAADDVEIARAAGLDVAIVPGDDDNLKLTYPQDFARAAQILQQRATQQEA